MENIEDYYNLNSEQDRLINLNSIERIRTQDILSRFIEKKYKSIIDIGGGTGVYSFWLADKEFDVTLIDFVPKHIEIAKNENSSRQNKLKSLEIGNACNLNYSDQNFDVALLFGPLYHLRKKEERVKAIKEALRVVKQGGVLFIAIISRFASLIDGYKYDFIEDNDFCIILDNDIKNGEHINSTDKSQYFMDTHFHSIDELTNEVEEAGYVIDRMLAVEGISNILIDAEDKMKNKVFKDYLLEKIAQTEEDKSIIGISSHIIAIVRKDRFPPGTE